jgi:hypothetical protein
VFIGTDYDESALRARLEDALVGDGERDFDGPFPEEQGAAVVLRDP